MSPIRVPRWEPFNREAAAEAPTLTRKTGDKIITERNPVLVSVSEQAEHRQPTDADTGAIATMPRFYGDRNSQREHHRAPLPSWPISD